MPATLIDIADVTLRAGTAEDEVAAKRREKHMRLVFETMPANQDEVLYHASLPAAGSSYGPGSPLILVGRRLGGFDDGLGFVVVLNYETPDWSGAVTPEDPGTYLDLPDELAPDFDSRDMPYFVDASDPPKPLVTTAGEPYQERSVREVGTFAFTVTGYRASIDAAVYASYLRPATAINSDDVTIRGLSFGIGQLRLRKLGIAIVKDLDQETDILRITWQLAAAEDWDEVKEDRGFMELVDVDGTLFPFHIVKGEPPERVTSPWPLDADGASLPNITDEPHESTYKPYPSKPFAVFGWTA